MKDKRYNFCGYFDDPKQTVPVFDPGFDVPCPCCGKKVGRHNEKNRLKTINLMDFDRKDNRSWFFRVHNNCWRNISDDDQQVIEMSVLLNKPKYLENNQ